ncbi:MAG: outer membrane beta-barrel protein [Bacteroidota bacterium]
MRKIVFVLVILLLSINLYAQKRAKKRGTTIKWISLAVKGGYGNSILFNQDVFADDNTTINFLSPAYNFGARFGLTFGDNFGIYVEPLLSTFKQDYDINTGTDSYTKTQKFKSFDILLNLRYTSAYGFYVEAGPVFNSLKSAEETNSIDGITRNNYIDNFADKYKSLMFGLGFAAFRGDRLSVNVGLRGTYALGDFVEDPTSFYVLNDDIYRATGTNAKTNPFSAKIMLEVNYFFAFWGDASCGRGRLMFFQ